MGLDEHGRFHLAETVATGDTQTQPLAEALADNLPLSLADKLVGAAGLSARARRDDDCRDSGIPPAGAIVPKGPELLY
jgi:hypothetical protein